MLFRWLPRRATPVAQRYLAPAQPQSGPARIAVRRLSHRYADGVEALREVDLEVHPGEFVCLLGPSGCGKSTLLYAIGGHSRPSEGAVFLDGVPVSRPGPDRLLMFQEPALFPWLSAQQNIAFALRAKGISRKDAGTKAVRFLAQVKLQGFEHALPHQLSGGMRMRVSLARALAMDPQVLLMDEPFAPLDAQTRMEMHQLLQSVWSATDKTVVFVTHDVREALLLGDRVVVMTGRPGRISQDLEVKLPRPRDPEDPRWVQLARHVQTLLKTEVPDEPTRERNDPEGGAGAGPPSPVGDRG